MKNLLFFGPTFYNQPLNDNLRKKYKYLSEIAKIYVVAFSDSSYEAEVDETSFKLYKKNKFRLLNYFKIYFISYFQLPKLVEQFQIDVVAFQDPITSYFGIRKLKKQNKNIKIVLETHGDFINTLELEKSLIFPKIYKQLFMKIAKYTINNADVIRAVSSSTEAQARSFSGDKLIVRFPAWVDFEIFESISNKREINEKFKILFIGSVTDRKKPHQIVEAISHINEFDCELNIVGPTPNLKYLNQLNKQIKELNLENKVNIFGQQNLEQVLEHYSKSNLMILPSVSEGLARVIFESQATACPVLVTDAPGMQDIVIDQQTGFIFESNNVKDMKSKIVSIYENYNQASQIGLNAKDFILNNYSAENFKFSFKKLIDLV
jgi:glycosyltransferase involved in cell wall biosynthesis